MPSRPTTSGLFVLLLAAAALAWTQPASADAPDMGSAAGSDDSFPSGRDVGVRSSTDAGTPSRTPDVRGPDAGGDSQTDAGAPDGTADAGAPGARAGHDRDATSRGRGAPDGTDAAGRGDAGNRSETGPRSPGDSPSKPELEKPELEKFVRADVPDGASRDRVDVVLKLTIDETGEVIDVAIHESGGGRFDRAAAAAARKFQFEPARRGGTPIKSRILYRYEFRGTSEPAGRLRGRVRSARSDGNPVAGARVELSGPDEIERKTRTDQQGRFEFAELPAGSYRLRVSISGARAKNLEVPVEPGETTRPTIRLARADATEPLEVTARGDSEADRRRKSAEAVDVVETEQDQSRSADLGEVVARNEGVNVRRAGGLGSRTRFSLNGLSEDKIRFFVDGVPLRFAGYPFGLSDVPVQFVERVEIFRGVVPSRYGANALGGAVNLVTDREISGTHATGSFQFGSFGTRRLAFSGSHTDESSGLYVAGTAFHDFAENDFEVEVGVPDSSGRLSQENVHRFHDDYRSTGGSLRVGVADKPWADRLEARLFLTDVSDEIQHNTIMTVPFGGVESGKRSAGASLRYDQTLSPTLELQLTGGFAHTRTRFEDLGDCVYNWFGQCTRDRQTPGEIDRLPRDAVLRRNSGYQRGTLTWTPDGPHELRFSIAPTFTTQDGEERQPVDPGSRDPLDNRKSVLSTVTGLEYQVDLFDERLRSVTFAKHYGQWANAEELLVGGRKADRDRQSQRVGFGESLRFKFTENLLLKASYEWATRLPRAEEIFGDGVRTVPNLDLEPEKSHNVNLGLRLVDARTDLGTWSADLSGFFRDVRDLILLRGTDLVFSFENVFTARSAGLTGSLEWRSPGDRLRLGGNFTYQDYRNTSDQGPFAPFEGDRIPNQPFLFANGSATFRTEEIALEEDQLEFRWNARYVNEYFRTWASAGRTDTKQTIPSQFLHTAGLTYGLRNKPFSIDFTAEIRNVTDQKAFDFFGVQNPGRSFFFKTLASF